MNELSHLSPQHPGRAEPDEVLGAAAGTSETMWVNRTDPDRKRNHVVFRTFWRLDATDEEALSVLSDYEHISDWWGETFLNTPVVHRPPTGIVGLTGDVTSRGYLPYIFKWRAEVIEADDTGITLSAHGDFNGTGRFRRPHPGEKAHLCFDWDVLIAKPILKLFTPFACPIYLWNHAHAMAVGARSLQAEIERRREALHPLPPKVPLSDKTLGPVALFKTGSANIVSTIPAQLLSQPMMSGRMFWKWHSIAGPAQMRRVLVENEANYPKAPVVRRILRPAVQRSLFLADGADHQWQRKASTPYFTMRRSLAFIPTFLEAADVQAARLPEQDKFRMDALHHMTNLALSVIVRVTCSTGGAVDADQIREAFAGYLDTIARLSPLDLLSLPPGIASTLKGSDPEVLANLRRQIDAIVERRLADGADGKDDLLQGLIDSTDPKTGKPMSVDQVRDNILLLVIAGHETTANTLGWAVHMLATHPDIQARARQEAVAAFEGPAEALPKSLPLISNVIDETLRLYPALPLLLRKTAKDDTVEGCPVRHGSFMFLPFYALHRNRRYWRDPNAFRPDRFAADAPDQIEKNQYLPFSAGPRSCVGAGFALLEMRIVLADFLRRFEFSAVPDRAPTPVALLALKPEGGVWIDVKRRDRPDSGPKDGD